MNQDKRKVLLLTDWYYPGFKAGGPIQSCVNLVRKLGHKYEFFVVAGDRDLGVSSPYEAIEIGCWTKGPANENVYYVPAAKLTRSVFFQLLENVQPEVVYLNNMFSVNFALLPYWWLRITGFSTRLVWAPRGMLHPGALQLKSFKKKLFLTTLKLIGFPEKMVFQATSTEEYNDIRRQFPMVPVILAENIPHSPVIVPGPVKKEPGILSLVFISRIHPKKNLMFLLKILAAGLNGSRITLDIYGDAESPAYEEECQRLVECVSANTIIRFMGSIENSRVFETLRPYHIFVLPSLGENFGHAIFEALASGKPVLISDQTPWRRLEALNAGWDIPLSVPHRFKEVLQWAVEVNQQEYDKWSVAAGKLAAQYLNEAGFEQKYKCLFE